MESTGRSLIARLERRSPITRETLLGVVGELPFAVALLEGADLELTYANEAFEQLASGTSLTGRPLGDIWPELAAEAAPALARVLEHGGTFEATDLPFERARAEGGSRCSFFTFLFCRIYVDDHPVILLAAADTTDEVRARLDAETAANEARQRSSMLSEVFEGMADAYFSLDADWRIRYVTERGATLLRRPKAELVGRVIWDVHPETAGTVFRDELERAMREHVPVSFEEFYAPLGIWASVQAFPRSPGGLSVFISDITSRKRAEAALTRSEGQLRDVIDNSPNLIHMKDLDGRFLRVNDEFARVFGISRDQIVGRTDFDLLPSDVAESLADNDRAVVSEDRAVQFEEDVHTRDGESRTYLTTKFPLRDISGRVYGTAGISTDITSRSRQERALAESEERFRKIFDEGPIGIVLYDTRDFHIVRVNDTYATMLGYSKGELSARTPFDLTDTEEKGEAIDLARQLVRGEIPYYRIEKRYIRKNGDEFWVSVTGSLLRDEAGRPAFILGMVEDVTQRRQAEEALRDKDRAIRKAYTDVIGAVTGGKLILMTPDEMQLALGEPVGPEWPLTEFAHLSETRHAMGPALIEAGLPREDLEAYILAAGEAMANAVKHGGGGVARVRRCEDGVQIEVTDHGPAIDFEYLPRATLLPGFSTKQSLGMGFTIMLDACDRVLLTTQPGLTTVVLEKTL